MRTYTVPVGKSETLVQEHDAIGAMVRGAVDALPRILSTMSYPPDRDEFYGRLSFADMRKALAGDVTLPDTYSDVVAALPPIGDDVDARTVRSVAGARPNVGAACAGSVRSMYATRHVVAHDVPIRIAFGFGGWHAFSVSVLSNAAAGVIAAAMSLQQAGGAVELFYASIVTGGTTSRNALLTACPVPLDAVDPFALAALAHSGVTRAALVASIAADRPSTRAYTSEAGGGADLTQYRNVVKAWSPVPVLAVPSIFNSPAYTPVALTNAAKTSAVAVRDWVLSQVDELLAIPAPF